jgi:hypothetical protein
MMAPSLHIPDNPTHTRNPSAPVIQQEVYFIHVNGNQRGPYTSRQICHLVNSGLAPKDALFWCEGMDQWQPVEILLDPSTPASPTRRKWRQIIFASTATLLAAAGLAGPTISRGWKEERQVERTPLAVYWRARGITREAVRGSALVNFAPFDPSMVRSLLEDSAEVVLEGTRVDRSGEKPARWKVQLQYDKKLKSWGPNEAAVTENPESESQGTPEHSPANSPSNTPPAQSEAQQT